MFHEYVFTHIFESMFRAQLLDQGLALQTSEYLKDERAYAPWTTSFTSFEFIDTMMASTGQYGFLKVITSIVTFPQ